MKMVEGVKLLKFQYLCLCCSKINYSTKERKRELTISMPFFQSAQLFVQQLLGDTPSFIN